MKKKSRNVKAVGGVMKQQIAVEEDNDDDDFEKLTTSDLAGLEDVV